MTFNNNENKFEHVTVLKHEAVDALAIKPDGIYVDCTAGGGGHSFEIAGRLGEGGRLIALDRDEAAIRAAGARLAVFGDKVSLVRSNFSDFASVLDELGIAAIDGVLMDLGVSSHQIDTAERGFSYMHDAPLDMRMDTDSPLTAEKVVNEYSEEELVRIFFDYGEEKFSRRIAGKITEARKLSPIKTTGGLAELIKGCVPFDRQGGHPAKRVFQAIRIEVNSELSIIAPTIKRAVERLTPGGRVAVITFHSLEDRITKQTLAELANGCTCPRSFPVCVCGKKPVVKVLTGKPVLPGEQELEINPRSHSAKLRIAEKK